GLADFDLALCFTEQEQTFRGRIMYASELFERSTVERWVAHFMALVANMSARPESRLAELQVLSESQRRQLLDEFNATQVTLPDTRRVHQMIEAQVASTATAVAVVYGDRSLTYQELNTRANQLAWYLQARGVGPGERVGICIERSPEMLWAVLGVLKAGAAYVPLDPSHPAERLAFVLADVAPALVLTRQCFAERLPSRTDIVCLDLVQKEIALEPGRNLDQHTRTEGDALAYIIYTSGSSGRPKGVMIAHSGLSNYLGWAVHTYGKIESQGAPVSSPLSFDATITSLFMPLLLGLPVLLVPDGDELQILPHMLLAQRLGPVKITPSHLNILGRQRAENGERDPPHTFVVGGEALLPATVDQWRSICPEARLFNEYGPTETVVGCCVYDTADSPPGARSVPIGRPIWNTRIYILSAALEPVPVGVVGEIYIGGAGVARGYVNRPGLTAERFLCDPFSIHVGARMYRSGDLGRWRADGNIEYLGRNDRQVKIRGFRIELDEIEAHLRAQSQIHECVVVMRETGGGEKRLIAYYTAGDDCAPSAAELSDGLHLNLPD